MAMTSDSVPLPDPNMEHDFEKSELYHCVYRFVQEYMSRYDMSHDFNHILRVLALSKHILVGELKTALTKELQTSAVVLAALLHDVGDRKYIQPGEQKLEQCIGTLLARQDCPAELVRKIVSIVQHVSYSSEIKHPEAVKAVLIEHPELAIVQDADRLDAIGAVGIGRTFAYGAAKAADRSMQGSIDHFPEKLEKLAGMMKTETGKRMARERTRRLTEFRRWWEEENNLTS